MPDIPAEAVEAAARTLLNMPPGRLNWNTSSAARNVLAAALPHLRAQWLAEVDEALRDNERVTMWLLHAPVNDHLTECEAAADYLRDVLGAEGNGT